MKIEGKLSVSDSERVSHVLARLSNRINRKLTLTDLLDEWSGFVVTINQGYGWSMETYTRDLAVRDIIEEISESLSMAGRRTVAGAIRESDQEFILATWDPDRPEETSTSQTEIGWWQFRVPKYPRGKLLNEMMELGYVNIEAAESEGSNSQDVAL